jgi:hypothetical protein
VGQRGPVRWTTRVRAWRHAKDDGNEYERDERNGEDEGSSRQGVRDSEGGEGSELKSDSKFDMRYYSQKAAALSRLTC